jgi:hypothetical protein
MKLSFLFSLTLLTASLSMNGCKKAQPPQPPPPPKPVSVLMEIQVFSMPRALAVQTVLNQPASTDTDTIFKNVQKLVESKQATLVATPAISSISGQQCIVESIREFRYPTEFEQPQISQSFGNNSSTVVTKVTKTTTVTEETTSLPKTPSTPTAFEVKNTGISLQLEPSIYDDRSAISFNVAFQTVVHCGNLKYRSGEHAEVEQPEFYTKKITSNVAVKNGGMVLIGTIEPDKRLSKDEDLTEVVFMRATIR